MQLVESDAATSAGSESGIALLALAVIHDVASLGFVGNLEMVASLGDTLKAEHFDGSGRRSVFYGTAAIVKQGADFAEYCAADEEVAGAESAILDEDRGHRAATFVHARFENGAAAGRVRVCLEFAQIGDQQNNFKQAFEALFLLRRDFDEFGVAAPFSGHQSKITELTLDAFWLRLGLINFVDGNDDGNVGGLGVVDGFFRLRHNTIVRGNNQDNDIRNFRAARTHTGEGFVTGRIDENDGAVVDLHFVRADVLRDATSFAGGDFGFANGVKKAGLAVIDVAHDRDDRGTRLEIFLGFFLGDFEHHLVFEGDDGNDTVETFGKLRGGGRIERLVDAGENSLVEENLQKVFGAHVEFFGEFANGDAFGDVDVARRTRLWRSDDGSSAAVAGAGTLASRMKLALAFHLALVGTWALALCRTARVERLAWLSLGRHLVRRRRREHAGPAGLTRTRARASRSYAWTLSIRRAILRAAGTTLSTGARRIRTTLATLSALLRTHGLTGARAARAITGRKRTTIASGHRAAVPCWKRTTIASRQRTLRLRAGTRRSSRCGPLSAGLAGPLLPGNRWTLSGRTAGSILSSRSQWLAVRRCRNWSGS